MSSTAVVSLPEAMSRSPPVVIFRSALWSASPATIFEAETVVFLPEVMPTPDLPDIDEPTTV
jgi:hypothetical protein